MFSRALGWLVLMAVGCTPQHGASEVGMSPGAGGMAGAPAEPDAEADALLSRTGLYLADMHTLAPNIERFTPAHALWADGAEKERFVYLPPGTRIDTSAADSWRYPVGTKLWKSFAVDGQRIETRLLEKREAGWFMMAYLWRESGDDADAVPDGRVDARGTSHDVPNEDMCRSCHVAGHDVVLGFSAVQLAGAEDGLSPADLNTSGQLSEPVAPRELPGDATARAALGYLHANCGSCHRPGTAVFDDQTQLDLWLTLAGLAAVELTPAFTSTVNQPTQVGDEPELVLVEPGDAEASALWLRMGVRDRRAMPPLAREHVDEQGLGLVAAFIEGLRAP